MNSLLPWIVLLAPLVSAAVITLFTRRWKMLSSSISIAAVLVSFICSCFIFAHRTQGAAEFTWISISGVFQVPLGLTLDQLSRTMAVLVSGVGAVIHIYSLGYMRDDEGKSRYFAALSLFMFAMLGIVLANNFVMLFMFWELVGFTSYVLIGHWFYRDSAADAAKKAFITTRIGDFGFMIGILMVWIATGSVVFAEIAPRMSTLASHSTFVTVVALLVFCGAVGKSAANLCFDSRGDDGRSRRLHARARCVRHSIFANRTFGCCVDRHDYRGDGCANRDPTERHQADPRLLHALATRLHGHGCGPCLE